MHDGVVDNIACATVHQASCGPCHARCPDNRDNDLRYGQRCHRFTRGLRCELGELSKIRILRSRGLPMSLVPYAQDRWSMEPFTVPALIQRRWFLTNGLNVAIGAKDAVIILEPALRTLGP